MLDISAELSGVVEAAGGAPPAKEGQATTPLPLGTCIQPEVRTFLLDEERQPVAAGEVGALHLAGPQLFDGYVGLDEATADKLFELELDVDGARRTVRLYNTLDRAVMRPGGALEHMGRADDMVKMRGFRIQLSEVDFNLMRCEGVAQALTLLSADKSALVSFVGPKSVSAPAVRKRLRKVLPGYMVPAQIFPLEALPFTAGGKVDRKALAAMHEGYSALRASTGATPAEQDDDDDDDDDDDEGGGDVAAVDSLSRVFGAGKAKRQPAWYYATSHAYFISMLVVVTHHMLPLPTDDNPAAYLTIGYPSKAGEPTVHAYVAAADTLRQVTERFGRVLFVFVAGFFDLKQVVAYTSWWGVARKLLFNLGFAIFAILVPILLDVNYFITCWLIEVLLLYRLVSLPLLYLLSGPRYPPWARPAAQWTLAAASLAMYVVHAAGVPIGYPFEGFWSGPDWLGYPNLPPFGWVGGQQTFKQWPVYALLPLLMPRACFTRIPWVPAAAASKGSLKGSATPRVHKRAIAAVRAAVAQPAIYLRALAVGVLLAIIASDVGISKSGWPQAIEQMGVGWALLYLLTAYTSIAAIGLLLPTRPSVFARIGDCSFITLVMHTSFTLPKLMAIPYVYGWYQTSYALEWVRMTGLAPWGSPFLWSIVMLLLGALVQLASSFSFNVLPPLHLCTVRGWSLSLPRMVLAFPAGLQWCLAAWVVLFILNLSVAPALSTSYAPPPPTPALIAVTSVKDVLSLEARALQPALATS